ncbi:Piso0_005352 [Millerozyma farinosa CBS 7064]|uniref:Inositol hexakisphosphate and diphosphoinositol-pentakisphosphate kinase n=1 Tax=Pichia sorbitophila (strain ATCC MYA-4447 / BCRC 22081 / CBS 7064 / NBRC 10061 / NRRL Y-12695) TaxID=559304 RepID=G8Y4W2_PICSO|nr:Piso0_005352 [Millerozyma farinosa CBS 7064]
MDGNGQNPDKMEIDPLDQGPEAVEVKEPVSPLLLSTPNPSQQTVTTPATEKAMASIAPMLESFAPKTNAEDSRSSMSRSDSSPVGSDKLTVDNLHSHEAVRSKKNSRNNSLSSGNAMDSGMAKLNKTLSNSSSASRKSVSFHKEPEGPKLPIIGKIGVCAMDTKAMSKPCRRILNRLIENGEFETVIFGDKVILDESIENWPTCDFLVSFFSSGFPLDKAIQYVNYRKPYIINDLVLQKTLWDRRLVLAILSFANVPTPERLEISRDGGPHVDETLEEKMKEIGMSEESLYKLTHQEEPQWKMVDEDTLMVEGRIMKKPFVEKPVDGEDHNVYIYYPKSTGGGGRRLFRKIGNKSSEFDPELSTPRTEGSFIYEAFMDTDNFEDVKAYTVGPEFCHAETRKSPVVDGIVRRNTHGKEIRFVTPLSEEEKVIARNVSATFRQTICGFDLLRVNGKSFVIDVNGFSFVKDNNEYYDKCARILTNLFIEAKKTRDLLKTTLPRSSQLLNKGQFEEKEQKWVLKGLVSVIRHADRTPKQKFKYSFRSPLFISLLKGHREEVIIRAVQDLRVVLETVKIAETKKLEDPKKLQQLRLSLEKKMEFPGTKIQLKPSINSENPEIVDKVQLILKWGGEPTHSAQFQTYDVGEQLRQNIKLLNREALNDVKVFTSSERRVVTSANLSTMALLGLEKDHDSLPDDFLIVRKDLLDDSNAAKDLMDKVKKKLKPLIRQGAEAPPQFTWPPKMPEPFYVVKRVCELMHFHKEIMEYNFETKDVSQFQPDWCCGEDPQLFKERWDKLFQEFTTVEKTHPSKISELYDTMKYDALHNRNFLSRIFAFDPNDEALVKRLESKCGDLINSSGLVSEYPINILAMNNFKVPHDNGNSSHMTQSPSSNPNNSPSIANINTSNAHASAGSLGWVLKGTSSTAAGSSFNNNTNTKTAGNDIGENPFDHPLFARLRELYRLSKVLFDFICPQEYGIKDEEKLDIGLLTSLPLAKQILSDIQAMRDNDAAAVVIYFTKESHIYTLLNVIYGSQIPMKIARNALPELDYLSQIGFELYEADDPHVPSGKKHSIRLSLSPGCHTQDPLDVQLDNNHYIGCIPRISLTRHLDMDLVTQRLRSRFSRVSLPKKFTPVNISSPLATGI